DADRSLNGLSPRGLIGGRLPLRRELAEGAARAVNEQAAFPDAIRLADAAVRIAVANMSGAGRAISIQRGHDPRDHTLVPFRGAGPTPPAAAPGGLRG